MLGFRGIAWIVMGVCVDVDAFANAVGLAKADRKIGLLKALEKMVATERSEDEASAMMAACSGSTTCDLPTPTSGRV